MHRSVLNAATQQAGRSPSHHAVLFRHIIQCAVNQRRHLIRINKSRPVELGRLQMWLDRNPYPSVNTCRAFPLLGDLTEAMPHHGPGKKMLEQARYIMLGLPLDTL